MINPRLSFIMSGPALGPGISRGLFSLRQITLRHVYACAGFARDVLARRKSEGWQSCAAYVGKSVKDCNCRGRGVSLKVGISDLIRTFKDIYGGLCICESGLFFHTYIRQFRDHNKNLSRVHLSQLLFYSPFLNTIRFIKFLAQSFFTFSSKFHYPVR